MGGLRGDLRLPPAPVPLSVALRGHADGQQQRIRLPVNNVLTVPHMAKLVRELVAALPEARERRPLLLLLDKEELVSFFSIAIGVPFTHPPTHRHSPPFAPLGGVDRLLNLVKPPRNVLLVTQQMLRVGLVLKQRRVDCRRGPLRLRGS